MFAIALCVDRNYLVPALVTLTSLADSITTRQRSELAVRIVSPDLRRTEASTAGDVCRRLGFGSFGVSRHPHLDGTPINHGKYITRTTYLRFALHEDFIGRPFVLYLDADVLVLDDLSAGFESLTSQATIGLVRDGIDPVVGYGPALPGLVDRHPHLKGRAYYNAGAAWMATSLLPAFRRGPLECLRRGADLIHFNDQDALNLWVLRNGHAVDVAESFNRFELDRFRQRSDWVNRVVGPRKPYVDPHAVHFVGPDKPWLPACPRTEAVDWYRASLRATRALLRRVGDLTVDAPSTGQPDG